MYQRELSADLIKCTQEEDYVNLRFEWKMAV